ncbi:dnaJ [Symbiodinium pilosum]|uniref:DnaJ protein n=1 Tax=Symbiodinium pilosum TaxID=2952 RepID=A0A812IUP5_SYMPI|nr:dnaJ [Symbiodinium pilosum]
MHAYLGTGLEVLSDKGGREEFRCDILETPTMFDGVCEVSVGTPAGFYNFTYVLQDAKTGEGYGRNSWEAGSQGLHI